MAFLKFAWPCARSPRSPDRQPPAPAGWRHRPAPPAARFAWRLREPPATTPTAAPVFAPSSASLLAISPTTAPAAAPAHAPRAREPVGAGGGAAEPLATAVGGGDIGSNPDCCFAQVITLAVVLALGAASWPFGGIRALHASRERRCRRRVFAQVPLLPATALIRRPGRCESFMAISVRVFAAKRSFTARHLDADIGPRTDILAGPGRSGGVASGLLRERETEHGTAAGRVLGPDASPVGGNDRARDRQPQPHAFGLGGEKRIEKLRQVLQPRCRGRGRAPRLPRSRLPCRARTPAVRASLPASPSSRPWR